MKFVGNSVPTRHCKTDYYTFGFNSQEKDNEYYGEGNAYDFGERGYDPRIARFRSIDKLANQYPHYSPYQFAGNQPIWAIDLDGKEEFIIIRYYDNNNKLTGQTFFRIENEQDRIHKTGVLIVELHANQKPTVENNLLAYDFSNPLNKDFFFNAQRTGFLNNGDYFATNPNPTEDKDLDKLRTNHQRNPGSRKLIYQNPGGTDLPYDYDSDDITTAAQQKLDAIATFLNDNPDYALNLEGHSSAENSTGNATYNEGLSKRRAASAKDYLVGKGVSSNRITYQYKGDTEPVAPNDTEENRSKNRRVRANFTIPKKH